MDNLDESETTAKVSDSAYSNSCSNSQSRRSHSSKSTHSGSNSSGSSGYGGKPSTSGSSNTLGQPPKKEKEIKKKKLPLVEAVFTDAVIETEVSSLEPAPVFDAPTEEICNVAPVSPPMHTLSDKGVENMEISTSDRNSVMEETIAVYTYPTPSTSVNYTVGRSNMPSYSDGFSCVISMHDGVVMYTTSSLTVTLGFPKDMWIGRSFIDFIHPKDQNIFASQITIGLAVPPVLNGTQLKAQPTETGSTMVCRIRRYRGLATGFGVKDRNVSYMPFLLKLAFKNVNDEEGKFIYLVIQAIPFFSAFRIPNEPVINATPFVLRHAANGNIEYVAPESVPYLGYLPQDLTEKDALLLYHPDDLSYLRQVYETIVKEGGLLRSKVYRMLTQNGDYVKLETEWSSFINPWSKKLEFVIGKHHLIEGPTNPDVFDLPSADKTGKLSEEDKNKAAMFREAIIRIMNEVPTKPAEVAKQQMTKRCQDVALFMESLMEEQPKTDEELRLEIQDPDNSYYERDSVMLGGISPHHDHNDSKSSTETPLSYNQLNYHETLQRYFDSHQAQSPEVCSTIVGENVLGLKDARPVMNNCLSPMAQYSGDSVELSSSAGSNAMALGNPADTGDSLATRLTEFLLNKHNSEMEKELMKMHREIRTSSKGEREKATNETRQKKKEHLARCNASFQPTSAGAATADIQPHGVKRSSKYIDSENKHHYPSQRHQSRRQRQRTMSTSVAVAQPITTVTATHAGTPTASFWPNSSVNNMNTFILGVGIPQQMSFVSPVPAMPGMFPMYYAPSAAAPTVPTTTNVTSTPTNSATMCQPPTMQCMMYGQPMYGSPFVYPMSPQMSNPFQQTMMGQTMMYNGLNPLGLTNRNYEEACKPNVSLRTGKLSDVWRDKKRHECNTTSVTNGSAESSFSTKALNRLLKSPFFGTAQEVNSHSSDMVSSRIETELADSSISKSTEAVPDTSRSAHTDNKLNRFGNSEEAIDRTDGESSYSSFYSSFFKTESGSAEESGDAKKNIGHIDKRFRSSMTGSSTNCEPKQIKKVAKRNMDPPWLEKVCVTSELIYKYQILTKSIDEVLIADKQKLSSFEQPTLVNDQLGQLYLDMQLEGQAARLTLEEGITSSSSSGEESATNQSKNSRRRREYSKLTMIYEEDAPLPPAEKSYGEPEACGSNASTF